MYLEHAAFGHGARRYHHYMPEKRSLALDAGGGIFHEGAASAKREYGFRERDASASPQKPACRVSSHQYGAEHREHHQYFRSTSHTYIAHEYHKHHHHRFGDFLPSAYAAAGHSHRATPAKAPARDGRAKDDDKSSFLFFSIFALTHDSSPRMLAPPSPATTQEALRSRARTLFRPRKVARLFRFASVIRHAPFRRRCTFVRIFGVIA